MFECGLLITYGSYHMFSNNKDSCLLLNNFSVNELKVYVFIYSLIYFFRLQLDLQKHWKQLFHLVQVSGQWVVNVNLLQAVA